MHHPHQLSGTPGLATYLSMALGSSRAGGIGHRLLDLNVIFHTMFPSSTTWDVQRTLNSEIFPVVIGSAYGSTTVNLLRFTRLSWVADFRSNCKEYQCFCACILLAGEGSMLKQKV